jgi:FtsP/CotA-like multicopper oxidase with cupredoxin domain
MWLWVILVGCMPRGGEPADAGSVEERTSLDATWSAAPDLDPAPEVVEVELVAAPHAWDPGTGAPLLDGLAYNGQVPGPVIEVERGQTLRVRLVNQTDAPLTNHWHGLRVPVEMDGIMQMMDPLQPGETFTYEFEIQDAGFYWYHPHMETDRLLERGLVGAIVAREPGEQRADVDVPVVLDDVLLDRDDQIAPAGTDMDQIMGRLGDQLLFNGRAGREIEVRHGQHVLLRLVNASNARFWDLALEQHDMQVVATDGGWLAEPQLVDHLVIAPGERYVVQIAMDGNPAAYYRLMNRRFQLHADHGEMVEIDPLGEEDQVVARFNYAPEEGTWGDWAPPAADVPAWSGPVGPVAHRWELDEDMMEGVVTIDGASWPDVPMVHVTGGAPTTFEVHNASEMHHPFHIHGNRFQIVALDGAPWPGPPGWKDTWDVPPESTVTLVSLLDNPGEWMYHCHILEHAEDGMAGMMTVE